VVGSLDVLRNIQAASQLNIERKGTENNSLYVLEGIEEFNERLTYSYHFGIRFYDSFQKEGRYIWINRDASLECFCGKWPRGRVFLGQWPDELSWKRLRKEMKKEGGRDYVVRREWFDAALHYVRDHELNIKPSDLNYIACCIRC
jgi:hypothetical protein